MSTVSALILLGITTSGFNRDRVAGGRCLAHVFSGNGCALQPLNRVAFTNLASISAKFAKYRGGSVFGQVDRERQRLVRQGQCLQESMIARARVAGQILGVTEFSVAMTSAMTLLAGMFAISAGTASVGAVMAAISIVGILLPPLRDLGRVQEYWHSASIARERIQEFLNSPSLTSQADNAPDLIKGSGRLEFDAVGMTGGAVNLARWPSPARSLRLSDPMARVNRPVVAGGRLMDRRKAALCDGPNLAEHNGFDSPGYRHGQS